MLNKNQHENDSQKSAKEKTKVKCSRVDIRNDSLYEQTKDEKKQRKRKR